MARLLNKLFLTNWVQEASYVATATVHAAQSATGQVNEDVGSALGHATRVSPATVSGACGFDNMGGYHYAYPDA